jgi:hypothetical protein
VIGSFQLNSSATNYSLTGLAFPNQTWVLQASSNLVTWQSLLTNVSTPGGQLVFSNAWNPAQPWQFFRIGSP